MIICEHISTHKRLSGGQKKGRLSCLGTLIDHVNWLVGSHSFHIHMFDNETIWLRLNENPWNVILSI